VLPLYTVLYCTLYCMIIYNINKYMTDDSVVRLCCVLLFKKKIFVAMQLYTYSISVSRCCIVQYCFRTELAQNPYRELQRIVHTREDMLPWSCTSKHSQAATSTRDDSTAIIQTRDDRTA
jgi:hypothetical protein